MKNSPTKRKINKVKTLLLKIYHETKSIIRLIIFKCLYIPFVRVATFIRHCLKILIKDPLKIIFIPLNILLIISFPFIIPFLKIHSNFLKPEKNLKPKRIKTVKELVSIIIINYNAGKLLSKCIDSILKQNYKNYEIVIIDNASKDKSIESIIEKGKRIRTICNKQNIGFSHAANQGINIARGEYILLLNFDILMNKNFLKEMVKAINLKRNIGSISGRLLKNEKLFDSTGIIMNNLFANDRGENEKVNNRRYNSVEYIFGPSGAAALYKKKMLEDCRIYGEIFDKDFWIYYEDVDLAWRAQIKGWKSFYTPKAIAYHRRGVTRRNNPKALENYRMIGYANRILSIFKNLPIELFIKNFFTILKYQIRNFFYVLVYEKYYFFTLEYTWILKRLPAIFLKRKIIMREGKVDTSYLNNLLF